MPPRPIGTERAWKNYSGMGATVGEPELNTASWLWAAGTNLSTLERHQLYRSQGPAPFTRLLPDELPTIIDTAYQVQLLGLLFL